MDSSPALSLEQFAEVTARIDAGTPREAALREAGISAEAWEKTQETWLSQIAAEVAQKRYSLHKRYHELLTEYRKSASEMRERERRGIREESAPGPGPKPEPKPAAPKPAPVPNVIAAAEPSPTTLPLPPAIPAPPPVIAVPVAPPQVAPPPVIAAPVAPPQVAPPPLVKGAHLSDREMAAIMAVPENTPGDGTLPIPKQAPAPPAEVPLPFRPPSSPPGPAPPAIVAPPERAPGVVASDQKRTMAISAVPDLAASPLPFKAEPSPPAIAKPHVKGQIEPEQKRTIAFSAVPEPGAELPFQSTPVTQRTNEPVKRPVPTYGVPFKQAPSTPPPPMRPSAPPPPMRPSAPPPPMRPSAPPPPMRPPSSPPPPAPPPQLTLAQYARVCVEMWKAPARGAEICARYGITDAQAWAAVNQLWQERINSDPTLKQRWAQLTGRMQTPRSQR